MSRRCVLVVVLVLVALPQRATSLELLEWVAQGVAWARCMGSPGNANVSTSGAGSDFVHTLSCHIPLNRIRVNTVISACALLSFSTASTTPQMQLKLKACTVPGCGSGTTTTLVAQGAFSPVPSTSTNGWVCFKTVSRGAPSASTPTDSSWVTTLAALTSAVESNNVAQPLNLNTLVAQHWTLTSQWLTNVGAGSTVTLNALSVMLTN